ncbi:flagellar biosynthesis protein FlhB [Pseudothauera rhizosphaerae]|uniref:Flagellar biosynthetic protein FlhB n=1 Tax=Pseudothauera rhizosphaerae TaxID=2565932 RepID=A0A4S4AW35_9RHOO|nr:flagellar biosynthesis protein FlhB [Pseudothauera rhizosphaerae]THF64201.1 flagellar type III secretion system protein FlhB [Pseudothauera rhizosphaerae]
MAEDSDLEKTEQPSARRLEQAREEGQVPQSRELSTFLVIMTGVATLWMLGGWFAERMHMLIRRGFHFEREAAFDHTLLLDRLHDILGGALITMLPLFGALLLAAVAAPIALGGLVFSPKVLGLKFDRMDPLKGLGRMFSTHGLMEMVKAALKALLVGGIGAMVLWNTRDHIFDLMIEPLEVGMPDFAETVLFTTLMIAASLGLLALLDVPFQLWQYHKKLRMTKEEVKRESKEQEGDPQLKGRIRQMQREMARKRMMAAVPEADVVVTNPTHFSVALKYDAAKMGAPVVVAKGRGETALKIREIAREHDVPMLEAPPLARALYAHCELEQAIPAGLYTAVAEVLAYVYQLNNWMAQGGLPPQAPTALQVPAGMDPGAPDRTTEPLE